VPGHDNNQGPVSTPATLAQNENPIHRFALASAKGFDTLNALETINLGMKR
jgi:hypothetical protein